MTEAAFLRENVILACDGALNGRAPWDRALNTVNGTNREKFLRLVKVIQNISAATSLLQTGEQKSGGQLAVTVQLMCVDSADVIYSLFLALLC